MECFWCSMLNLLRLSSKCCFGLAEIFSMTFFNFRKISYFILWFLFCTVNKLLTILYFYFLKIYYSAMFKKMFQISILGFSLMSQGLIIVEIVWISLILIEKWWEMWWKSRKKTWKCTVKKISKSYFFNFFSFQIVTK
jgi:hypothetical protein